MQSTLDTAHDPPRLRFWVVTNTIEEADLAPARERVAAVGAQLVLCRIDDLGARLARAPVRGHISQAAYYRLFLPEVLPPEVERVIYLDCDVVVCRAIEELWDTDLGGHAIAAVMKPRAEEFADVGLEAETDYFNSGVLVIDVARWRELGVARGTLEFAAVHPGRRHGHDQPGLNHVFNGQWKHLDPRWNQQFKFFVHTARHLRMTRRDLRRVRRDPYIIHFTTQSKPWNYTNTHPWRHRFFEVLDRTEHAGWRPRAGSWRERLRRTLLGWWPHPLRPAVLRNVYRPQYHRLKARLRGLPPPTGSKRKSPARG